MLVPYTSAVGNISFNPAVVYPKPQPKSNTDLHSLSYINLFNMMDLLGIQWEWLFAGRKGQHHNHQVANTMDYKWVWRVDDDNICEPWVLSNLLNHAKSSMKTGAVAGSILTPTWDTRPNFASGKIDAIDNEPNIQWGRIERKREVEHLHCSFLYINSGECCGTSKEGFFSSRFFFSNSYTRFLNSEELNVCWRL